MLYYVYFFTSFFGGLHLTRENGLLTSPNDLWRPVMLVLLIFSACVVAHTIAISVISLFASADKKPVSLDNFFRRVTLSTIDLVLHIMRMKLHVSGMEKLPENEKFLLVGNHLSVFDPMLAMSVFRKNQLAFVSKKENIEIPFGGRLMTASGCLPLDRENNRAAVKTIKQAAELISEDVASMGIYPEGGINKTGNVLLPFHSGSFKIAKKAKAPIVLVAVRNTEKLCRRFLFASTDVYLDVLRVITPEEYNTMSTNEISQIAWQEMYSHLSKAGAAHVHEDEIVQEHEEAACR